MIFVTVGHQMAFDRLIRLVDEWAGRSRVRDIFAQIGETDYRPKHMPFAQFMSRTEFAAQLERCSRVVAHAGVGTIIQTLEKQKPLLVLPRRSAFGETRSDHQVGTARHFADRGLIMAAFSDDELLALLDRHQAFKPSAGLGRNASPQLLARIRSFLTEQADEPTVAPLPPLAGD
jgi:UDP-N-acetylglucosamine transferase subunit ALG13